MGRFIAGVLVFYSVAFGMLGRHETAQLMALQAIAVAIIAKRKPEDGE